MNHFKFWRASSARLPTAWPRMTHWVCSKTPSNSWFASTHFAWTWLENSTVWLRPTITLWLMSTTWALIRPSNPFIRAWPMPLRTKLRLGRSRPDQHKPRSTRKSNKPKQEDSNAKRLNKRSFCNTWQTRRQRIKRQLLFGLLLKKLSNHKPLSKRSRRRKLWLKKWQSLRVTLLSRQQQHLLKGKTLQFWTRKLRFCQLIKMRWSKGWRGFHQSLLTGPKKG